MYNYIYGHFDPLIVYIFRYLVKHKVVNQKKDAKHTVNHLHCVNYLVLHIYRIFIRAMIYTSFYVNSNTNI